MVQLLGLIDIIAAFMLLARIPNWEIPLGMMIFISLCLVGKAVISLENFFGWIDLITVILLIISSFLSIPYWILLIMAIVMGIKGLVSVCSYA